jgi:hypothetical protein
MKYTFHYIEKVKLGFAIVKRRKKKNYQNSLTKIKHAARGIPSATLRKLATF